MPRNRYLISAYNPIKMPASVHSEEQDQSMLDASAPQEQEQTDVLELDEKRIVVVRIHYIHCVDMIHFRAYANTCWMG